MNRRLSHADATGRVLGVLGILVAAGASVFLYLDNQQLKRRILTLETTVAEPPKLADAASTSDLETLSQRLDQRLQDLEASDEAFRQKWNSQLNTEVQQFQTNATELFDRHAARFREQLTKLANDQPSETDFEALMDRKLDAFRTLTLKRSKPVLRVAEYVQKVTETDGASLAVIANDSERDAGIDYVSFRPNPDGPFEYDLPANRDRSEFADWLIRFQADENTATEEGRHHRYDRQFGLVKKWLRANQTTRVLIEIQNEKHLGWGLEGVLVIGYGDGSELEVDRVRAVFVSGEAEAAGD